VIAASGILVVIAFVTLIAGVFRTGLGLIWASIAASVLAAIFLALGVVQGNKRRVATAVGPSASTVPTWSDQPAPSVYGGAVQQPAEEEETAVMERPSLAAVPAPEEEDLAVYQPAAEAELEPMPAATRAAKPKRAASAASAASVVVIPDRDKYHKDTCRYAKSPAAMTLTKAAAKRQGYKPCGVCKP
jgi:hypothetical protein